MSPPGGGNQAVVLRLAVLAIACACLGAGAPARADAVARDGEARSALAEAGRLAGAGRFGAAESLLARMPPAPPESAAVLDREQVRLERARLSVRTEAPGLCRPDWAWRPVRLVAALERLGEQPVPLAGVWTDRARVEYRMGRWREAAASARYALALLDRARSREPLPRYRARLALAEALVTEDQLAAAGQLTIADSLARELGALAGADQPRHLRIAGAVALMGGRFGEAVRIFSKCVSAAEARTPPNDAEAGLGLLWRGYAEGFTGDPLAETRRTQARERLLATLGLGDERTLLVIWRSFATVRDPAVLPAAAALLERAQTWLRANGLSEMACAWDVDYAQSRVKIQLERFDESQALLRHALEVSRRWNGRDNLREYLALVDIGIVHWLQKDTLACVRTERQALEISAKHPISLVNDPNFPLNYLATEHAAGGRLAEAREEYAKMWEVYRVLYGDTVRLASIPAARAGRASRGLGDTLAAEMWFQRALLPFARHGGGSREEFAELKSSYALFLYWSGQNRRAFDIMLDNTRLRRTVVNETVPWFAENDGVRFANNRRWDIEILLSIALWTPGADAQVRSDTWTEMALGRGLVLEALLSRAHGAGDAAGGTTGLRRELATRVLASLRSPDSPATERGLDSLRAEISRRESGPREPGDSAAPGPELTPAAVSRRLGRGALVSYVRSELFERKDAVGDVVWWPREYYMAFVLAPGDTAPHLLLLGAADSVDAAVARWRAQAFASPPGARAFEDGERLRRLVWDPVVALLPAGAPVWMVPDGELQKVNFYALPASPGRWLVEQPLVLHRIGSERDLLAAPDAGGAAHGALVFGGVDYDHSSETVDSTGVGAPRMAANGTVADGGAAARANSRTAAPGPPACRGLLDQHFDPLPATRGEAAAIASLAGALAGASGGVAPIALSGPEADEAAFKRLAPGRRVIHLATHSYFLGTECASGSPAARVLAQNPLVFSGIVLAGANRWQQARERHEADDGLLTAEELAGLDLRGAEWLVLSGCESGLGQVKSWEGVFGLPRAGRRAGVRTLIMSLAPVDDDASSLWMRSLYDARFVRGEETAFAVRTASRRVIEWLRRHGRAPEPRLWGAFVALGE